MYQWLLKHNKLALTTVLAVLLVSGGIFYHFNAQNALQTTTGGQMMGSTGDSRASWVMVGVGQGNNFTGYQTKADPQKIDTGANPVGQNTYINDGDRISVRDFGYNIFPITDTESSAGTPITSIHTFARRDGTNIIMRAYGDQIDYYAENIGQWEMLKNGFTPGQEFGFADHNTNVDQYSYVYFCNAAENYQRWTGNIAKITTDIPVGTTTITVDDTTLFPSTGTLTYCGTTTAYTAKTTSTPFYFTVATTTITCASGHGIAQVPQEFAAAPKGNILMVKDTRMFVAGVVSSTQALFYSKLADASDFTFSGTRVATDGGIINMPEGGGGIVGMAQDETALYVFKRGLIKSVTFTQDGNDLPQVQVIKPFDDRSQAVGALSSRAIFSGANGIFFITPNNEIMHLSRIANIDYPQAELISDPIKPTVDALDFSRAKGVFYRQKAYFAAKQSTDSVQNDIILVYNTVRNAWESPIIGISVGDWVIANFNNTQGLYFGSAFGPNVYLTNNTPLDNGFAITANWRSREETFGTPQSLKSVDNFYVEGYITDNTHLDITLLYDENGFTQTQTTELVGNEQNDKYLFTKLIYNAFGLNPFGYERFGTNASYNAKHKFRVYLGGNLRRVPFYSVQVEFASTGSNDQWEILQYGYHVMPETQDMRTGLLRSW